MISGAERAELEVAFYRYESAREKFNPRRFKRGGSYSPADVAKIVELAGLAVAPTNAQRSAVEVYDFHLLTEPPEVFGYVTDSGTSLATWLGEVLVDGLRVTHVQHLPWTNPYSRVRNSYEVTVKGARYSGRGYGPGMSLVLKRRAT